MMKRAAVDIGTNSARLLIAEVGDTIKRIEKLTTITRLGSGVDRYRRINSEAINRNIEALARYRRIIDGYGISEVYAIATSAVRDAANHEEFVNEVKGRTGIDVEVISGDMEAELGFAGASMIMDGDMCTVIDIGGGSTEFIAGSSRKIHMMKSIDIGAVRMTEKFFNSGMSMDDAMRAAHDYMVNLIHGITNDIRGAGSQCLVGIGGTVTTLAAMDMELEVYDVDRVHGYRLYKADVDVMFSRLISMGLEERKGLKGLQSGRADIIPAGTLILKSIMEELDSEFIVVSEYDNLEGLLLKRSGY